MIFSYSSLHYLQMPPRPSQTRPSDSQQPPRQNNPPATARDHAIRRAAFEQRIEHQSRAFMKDALSKQPEPKLDDPDLTQKIRSHTALLFEQIQRLEAMKQRMEPAVSTELETSLVRLRALRNLVYWRIFRINDLPPEILANIIRYVVWSSTKPDVGVKYRLWLTWVCRHWRTVAISDFTLWNAIWFRELPPYEQSFTWLERAGTAPLDLRINERDELWNNEEDHHRFTGEQMGWLLDRLFTKLPQIRMLIIIVDTWPPALVALDRLRQAGTAGVRMSMERFELHRAGTPYRWIGPGYQPDNHRNPIPLFGGQEVPSLKYLSLNGIHIDWIKSPLANLTTLDLRRMALDVSPALTRFREILQNCPNLIKLALDGAGPMLDSTNIHDLKPIELPRLLVLVIGDFSLTYANYVMINISAPYVRDLTLMNMNGEDYSPFLTTITSCFKEVRILTLYTIEVDQSPGNQEILVKWLESMPQLGFLRIAQIRRHVLEAFLRVTRTKDEPYPPTSPGTPSPSDQIICPKLDVIEYQNIHADEILWFGSGRKALGIPLRKIYVNSPWVSSITTEQQSALRNLSDLFITATGASTPEEIDLMRR